MNKDVMSSNKLLVFFGAEHFFENVSPRIKPRSIINEHILHFNVTNESVFRTSQTHVTPLW